MPDHRRHAGVVELAGHEDGRVGIGVVVPKDQLEAAATHAPAGVDLVSRELRSQLHGPANGIGKGAGDADTDGSGSAVGAPELDDGDQHRDDARGNTPDLVEQCQVSLRSVRRLAVEGVVKAHVDCRPTVSSGPEVQNAYSGWRV